MLPAIEARNLRKRYLLGEVPVEALQGVDLVVTPGEFIAIMGPSGSGKSTLLHLLGGLDTASEGEVVFQGRPLSSFSDHEITLLRRRRIGVVFQFFNLLPTMTAVENVALPLLLDGVPVRQCTTRALESLAWVGLEGRAQHTPDRMSGGEQQRVALARALVTRPELLLADEPTGNLDSVSGERVLNLLRRARDEIGHTVVMVTHDPAAAAHADRVVFLRDGKVLLEIRGPGLSSEAIVHAQSGLGTTP
jgi:putative ABC transport system ATP-binding protein